jgi:hypothetical protein
LAANDVEPKYRQFVSKRRQTNRGHARASPHRVSAHLAQHRRFLAPLDLGTT